MKRHALLIGLLAAVLAAAPAATAQCRYGGGYGCNDRYGDNHYGGGYGGYRSGDYDMYNDYRRDYERGGLALDYFHTDKFFGREMRGFPDTMFGEDDRYDAISRHDPRRSTGFGLFGQQSYDDYYDSSNKYGAFTPLARHYGEGFVSGEGFGDEYIGDPDQLNEEIVLWH